MAVLSLVQALLGAISDNYRAVSLRMGNPITIYVLLANDDPEDRQEAEDIEFEFLALFGPFRQATTKVIVSSDPIENINLDGRLVFLRKSSP
jgi:hypothetical protein